MGAETETERAYRLDYAHHKLLQAAERALDALLAEGKVTPSLFEADVVYVRDELRKRAAHIVAVWD